MERGQLTKQNLRGKISSAMANASFDTLTASKDLQAAGIEARQADAIALAIMRAQGDIATKQDIALLKTDLKQMNADIVWMKWVSTANMAILIVVFSIIIGQAP